MQVGLRRFVMMWGQKIEDVNNVKMLPKVVAGHVQRTLARPAVIGPPQPRVAVVAFRARVARVPHRVVLARAALLR